MLRTYICFIVVVFCLLISCDTETKSSGCANDGFDRAPLLSHTADNIIIPAYAAFSESMDALDNATDAFVLNASISNFDLVKTKWLVAHKAWQYVEMFQFGEAEELSFYLKTNTYPCDTKLIEVNIKGASYDFTKKEPASYTAQGFPTLDYMLYGLGANDSDEILQKYQGDQNEYSTYLSAVVKQMVSNTSAVVAYWATNRDAFVGSSGNSATSSFNKLMNDYIFYMENGLRTNKFGYPSGKNNPQDENDNLTERDSLVEAFYKKDISKELALDAFDATRDFFNGKTFDSEDSVGPSIKTYLEFFDSESPLVREVNEQFLEINGVLQSLDNNFVDQIEKDNNSLLRAYDDIQKLIVRFKIDVWSKFCVSQDYVGTDGD